MRKKVYIAGPISKGVLAENLANAHNAGIALLRAGFAPMVPHGSCFWGNSVCSRCPSEFAFHPEANHSGFAHSEWLDMDLAWVAVADGVLRLPGESVGADKEVAFALSKNIPVFTSIEDAVAHFINKKAADATTRPADAGSAAGGAAPSVGGEKTKNRTWAQNLERGYKLTAIEQLMVRACKMFLAESERGTLLPSAVIGNMVNLHSAGELFFEVLDEDHGSLRAEAVALFRDAVSKRAAATHARVSESPVAQILGSIFGSK